MKPLTLAAMISALNLLNAGAVSTETRNKGPENQASTKVLTRGLADASGGRAQGVEQHQSAVPTVLIRFCDEVGLSEAGFTRFREQVSTTLRNAGVGSTWVYCSVNNPAMNPAWCREALHPTEIIVRLRAQGQRQHEQALGVSVAPKDGSGVYAHLHYAQIENLAARAKTDPISLLALIALHELGHLLMGPAHYPTGIMQSHWTESRLWETIRRDLFFQEFQARKLRVSLAGRGAR